MSTVVSFPFADTSLAVNQFRWSSVGCAFNSRTGRVSAVPYFLFPHEHPRTANILTQNDGATTNDTQHFVTSIDKSTEYLKIDGSLSVHYAMIGGEGSGSWLHDESQSITSFTLLQTSAHIVGEHAINPSALAEALATEDGHQFLHPSLRAPDTAQAMIDEQGAQFVSAVKMGGVVFRRVTFTCETAAQASQLKAELSGKLSQGPLAIKFTAAFEKKTTSERRHVSIRIETRAAGGDPTLLDSSIFVNGATDVDEVMAKAATQVQAWKRSVRFSGPDGQKDTTVVVTAQLDNIGRAFVPALRWTDHQVAAYERHVAAAVKHYWGMCVKEGAVTAGVERSEKMLEYGGLDRGSAAEIMTTVLAQKAQLVREYLLPGRQLVQAYLAKDPEAILLAEFEGQNSDKHEQVYRELMGTRQRMVQLQFGSELRDALWSGPYCSAKHEGGWDIGPYARPEAVYLIFPPVAGRRPQAFAKIPESGWDVQRGTACVGEDAVVELEPQMEDAPLVDELPACLRRRYVGRMIYNNHAQYDGAWSHGRRNGVGTMMYPDQSRYTGEFVDDQYHGHGEYQSAHATRFLFSGTFKNGKKHGEGTVRVPRLGNSASSGGGGGGGGGAAADEETGTVSGTWVDDVFVCPGPTTHQAAWETVSRLPDVLRDSWRGVHVTCVPTVVSAVAPCSPGRACST
jgi:hypothetical protein